MLEVRNIDVSYGSIQALHDISISLEGEEVVSIIGANGAGKSSLMKAIIGLCKPTKGEILFLDEPIHGRETHTIVRRGVVLVPEGRRVFPKLTVSENLDMGAFARSGSIQQELEEVFALFPRLKERRHQVAGTLSGGEQQMLAIGRGLMAKPKLLLLDEPSMGLAPVVVEEMFEVITRVHHEQHLPILLVEQNAFMALEISTRCYVLENGRVRIFGESKVLAESPEVKEAYLGG